jgi:membrane protein implicated in regulation of membrane protease activity
VIADLVEKLGAWNWGILGVVLLGLEIFAPGSFFVWLGIASIVVGILAAFVGMAWQVEVILFVVLAVVFVLIGRRLFARDATPGEQPFLNDRARRMVGSIHVLHEPIVDGQGRLKIDDTRWRVTGPDLPSGARVKVVGADGAVLTVAAVE